MNETNQNSLSRRSFILGTAAVGAGLTVGVYLTNRKGDTTVVSPEQLPGSVPVEWDPQAFVHIGKDNFVTVYCKHTEMGQGIYTGMATVVAEELDASWEQMIVEGAPANATLYSNLLYGEQFTGGSSSLQNSYGQLQQVGAAARQMLVAAAASAWNVPEIEVTVSQGQIRHDISDRSSNFGDLAELAMQQPVPETVVLKRPEQYRLIGANVRRIDVPGKTNGTVIYTQDFKLPNMLTAVVAHAPRFGATMTSFDAHEAKAIEGVVDVVAIPTGVAVIANDFWTATKARELLSIEWDERDAFTLSSEDLVSSYRSIVETEGTIARDAGSITDSFAKAQQVIEADFEFPFLAHSPLEPLNCIVHLSEDECEIWNAAQQQTRDQRDASAILGLAPEQIKVNMLYAGGAFGRRSNKDYTVEAVHVAKAADRDVPIKLVWTREDDMRAGQYRPLNYHRLRAGIDSNGDLVAWHHRLVGQSILAQEEPAWIVDGVDSTSVHGANDWLYDVPNIRVETHSPEYPVPVLWYRGTGATHTVYAVETFMDEIAALTARDPVEFRRSMLKEKPRMTNVLKLAAEKAGWGSAPGPRRGQGVAMCEQRGTYLAMVADVSVQGDDEFSVDRVVTAIDCGLAVNPDVIRAQMEGGIGFGLSSTLGDEITFKNGYVEQSNFDKYRLLRINQMPDVDVHIVPSREPLTGIGELAPMVIGAAVANALYATTGQRHRKLPIRLTV
jgi:isoquinoline 1-oxidoreductase beta subunit